MDEKFKTLQKLALDLRSQGFAREAEKVSNFLFKKALKIDVDFLNQVRDRLGDSILEMEYFPPGAGLFPAKQEVGVFFKDSNLENQIRDQLTKLGFDFQALVTDNYFTNTRSGVSSQAVKTLEKGYYVLIVTMEENKPSA